MPAIGFYIIFNILTTFPHIAWRVVDFLPPVKIKRARWMWIDGKALFCQVEWGFSVHVFSFCIYGFVGFFPHHVDVFVVVVISVLSYFWCSITWSILFLVLQNNFLAVFLRLPSIIIEWAENGMSRILIWCQRIINVLLNFQCLISCMLCKLSKIINRWWKKNIEKR